MLCQFLLCSKVNQLYIYIYAVFFRFPSQLGHHTPLSRVSCAMQQVLISYLFYTQQCIYVSPNLPIHPTLLTPLVTISLFSTSVTISVLQISSPIPFFQIPHISDTIRYLFLFLTYFTLYKNIQVHPRHSLSFKMKPSKDTEANPLISYTPRTKAELQPQSKIFPK